VKKDSKRRKRREVFRDPWDRDMPIEDARALVYSLAISRIVYSRIP
jgi:hypothetical protein